MAQRTHTDINRSLSYGASCPLPNCGSSIASTCQPDVCLTALAPQARFRLHGLVRRSLAMSMVAVDDALWESMPDDGALWLFGPLKKPSRWFYLLCDPREGPICRITVRRLGPTQTELRADALALADAESQAVPVEASHACQDLAAWLLQQLVPRLSASCAAAAAGQLVRPQTLPPITDPTDQRILAWVTDDPHLTDRDIAQRLGIHRQPVNERRRRLQAMGYKVR
jgi:DNA-binding CsgD family transcriptional regulator